MMWAGMESVTKLIMEKAIALPGTLLACGDSHTVPPAP